MPSPRLSLVLVLTLTMTPVSTGWAAQSHQSADAKDVEARSSILFLTLDDFTRPCIRLIFKAFTDAVSTASKPPAIYFESIDASRFGEPRYLENLRDWLARKYRDKQIDLIVPISEDAVGFLIDAHGELWPDAQVLYFESGSIRFDTRSTLPRAGGVLTEQHFADQLQMVKVLLPQTRHAAVIHGASTSEITRWCDFVGIVRQAGLEPVELVGLTMEEMPAAVAQLPKQSVVFVLAPAVDAKGNVVSANQLCEVIAATGVAPIFTTEANHLGCGAIGGVLRDWSIIGRLLGEEALARLKKPSTDVVTIPVTKYTTVAFDDRQVQRWNIPERRLPAGATVRFREPDIWRDRRGLVLATIGVTLVQIFLIAGLVFERRRRRAEIDLRRNLAALAHLDRHAAMGALTTSLAHELNQPLNAILQNAGMAQMLLTAAKLPSELSEIIDIIGDIRKDDIRASDVIRRMRGLLQKDELETHPVDLNDVVQETVAIVRPDARLRQIELDVDLVDGIRPILGDRVQLQQVLLNLLRNAMDAVADMPPARHRVRVSTTQSEGAVRLAVSDTGPGIPFDKRTTIFEPFYTAKTGGDMGMGLAIARGIIEAHDGRMVAENNTGGGATVWFSIPIALSQTKVL